MTLFQYRSLGHASELDHRVQIYLILVNCLSLLSPKKFPAGLSPSANLVSAGWIDLLSHNPVKLEFDAQNSVMSRDDLLHLFVSNASVVCLGPRLTRCGDLQVCELLFCELGIVTRSRGQSAPLVYESLGAAILRTTAVDRFSRSINKASR
jgi:hypothetical protein